jgi:hypothetical protein
MYVRIMTAFDDREKFTLDFESLGFDEHANDLVFDHQDEDGMITD